MGLITDFSGIRFIDKGEGLQKAHVKAHFRRDPKTGKLVFIPDYDDKRHKSELEAEFHKGVKVKITEGKHAGKEGVVTSYSEKYHEVGISVPGDKPLLIKPEKLEVLGGGKPADKPAPKLVVQPKPEPKPEPPKQPADFWDSGDKAAAFDAAPAEWQSIARACGLLPIDKGAAKYLQQNMGSVTAKAQWVRSGAGAGKSIPEWASYSLSLVRGDASRLMAHSARLGVPADVMMGGALSPRETAAMTVLDKMGREDLLKAGYSEDEATLILADLDATRKRIALTAMSKSAEEIKEVGRQATAYLGDFVAKMLQAKTLPTDLTDPHRVKDWIRHFQPRGMYSSIAEFERFTTYLTTGELPTTIEMANDDFSAPYRGPNEQIFRGVVKLIREANGDKASLMDKLLNTPIAEIMRKGLWLEGKARQKNYNGVEQPHPDIFIRTYRVNGKDSGEGPTESGDAIQAIATIARYAKSAVTPHTVTFADYVGAWEKYYDDTLEPPAYAGGPRGDIGWQQVRYSEGSEPHVAKMVKLLSPTAEAAMSEPADSENHKTLHELAARMIVDVPQVKHSTTGRHGLPQRHHDMIVEITPGFTKAPDTRSDKDRKTIFEVRREMFSALTRFAETTKGNPGLRSSWKNELEALVSVARPWAHEDNQYAKVMEPLYPPGQGQLETAAVSGGVLYRGSLIPGGVKAKDLNERPFREIDLHAGMGRDSEGMNAKTRVGTAGNEKGINGLTLIEYAGVLAAATDRGGKANTGSANVKYRADKKDLLVMPRAFWDSPATNSADKDHIGAFWGVKVAARMGDLAQAEGAINKQVAKELKAAKASGKSGFVPAGMFRTPDQGTVKQHTDNFHKRWDKGTHGGFKPIIGGVFEMKALTNEKVHLDHVAALKAQHPDSKVVKLYHGTDMAAAGSIARTSFAIPTKVKAGSMMGKGTYCTATSSKSCQYLAAGFTRSAGSRGIVFICDVATGKSGDYFRGQRGPDYDTCRGHKGDRMDSGGILRNDETVVRAPQKGILPRFWLDVSLTK